MAGVCKILFQGASNAFNTQQAIVFQFGNREVATLLDKGHIRFLENIGSLHCSVHKPDMEERK